MRSGNVYRVADITAATLEVRVKRTCVAGAADMLVAFALQSGARWGRKENGFCFQAALWPCGLDGHLVFAGKCQILKNHVIFLERENTLTVNLTRVRNGQERKSYLHQGCLPIYGTCAPRLP